MRRKNSACSGQKVLQRGFSLIEVLLALLVLATVIAAVSQVAGQSIRNTTHLKESTFARWVALNQIELYQLQNSSGQGNLSTYDQGEEEMGGLRWRWVREVKSSSATDILEIKVSVYALEADTEEEALAAVKSYMLAPNLGIR